MRRVIAAVLTAVLVIAAGALLWIRHEAAALETVRAELMAEAPTLVEDLLSYNSETVDRDLGEAANGATGSFKDGFVDFATTSVVPQSREKGISTRARVVDIGLLSAGDDHAELLMFVDQITTSFAQPAPASSSSRVRVTVERMDGRWFIGELTPI